MGRKGGGGKSKKGAGNKASAFGGSDVDSDPLASLGALFRQMPPKVRQELNGVVEKLLEVTSNFNSEPLTPTGLWEEHQRVRELVDKVRGLEEANNLNRKLLGSRRGHVAALMEWLEKHGAIIDGVKIMDYGTQGLGLRVTKPLSMGSVAVRIPRKVMMSVETAKDSEIGRLIERDPMLQTMPNVSLALHLLLEKTSPASFWEPYINTLPHSYDSTVLYFTPAELEALKGSPAYEDALKQYKYVARQYAYFYRKFATTMLKDYFTYEEYRWAVATVMTRQNLVPAAAGEGGGVNTLIPFWDMANHDPTGPPGTDYDDEADALKCMANRDFAEGEQFTMLYGERSNHSLLVHNGFVVADNPHDNLQIKLGVSKNDSLAKQKHELLEKLLISKQGLFTLSAGALDRPLLAFLRVMVTASEEELSAWGEGDKIGSLLDESLSESHPELEKKAHGYLLTRCTLLLRCYPTTLEQDEELMAPISEPAPVEGDSEPKKMSVATRFAVMLRMSEKKILKHTMEICKAKA